MHEAVKCFTRSVEADNEYDRANLVHCLENGNGIAINMREAVKWYKRAAEAGVADAQYNIAVCYDIANGITADQHEAFKWYDCSAKEGSVKALWLLGSCYEDGDGVLLLISVRRSSGTALRPRRGTEKRSTESAFATRMAMVSLSTNKRRSSCLRVRQKRGT